MAHFNPFNPQENLQIDPVGKGNAPNPNPNPSPDLVAVPRAVNTQDQAVKAVEVSIIKRKADQPDYEAKRQKVDVMLQAIDPMDRSDEKRDAQAQFYYNQILALIPEADLCDLNAFSEKMGNGFWDGYQVKADQKQPADLIFSLIQSFEPSERAKFLTILDEFCDSIVNTFDQRIDLQRYTYTLLCNIELIPSKNRLAKLTVAFNTICILGEVNDYEGAFYSGNRFLNVMPRLSKSQVEVMGQVVTHLFQKLRKVGENSGKLVNEIYDGLFQFREGKKGLIQVIDLASPFISKDASIFRYLMTVAPSKREKVVTGLILLGDYPDLSKAVLGLSMVDEEEIEVIAQFLSFVSKIDQGNPYSLIENLLQFSSEMRESMIMFLKANFPQLRLEAFDLSSLLNFLNETPPSEWISSLVLARDLSGLLKRPVSDLCALHIILEGIDHRSIRTFFEMMSIKLEGTNAQYASFTYSASMPGSLSQRRQVVLKGLFNHPIERVEALLDKLKPFLENNLDYFSDLVDILSTLLTIEPENLSEAIDLICSSIKNLNNVSHSALMKSMTIVQLREFVPLLKCVLQSVTGRDIGVDNFVQVLENCNPEEKMYLLSAVLPYIPSLGIFGALKGLLSIPAAERVETLKLVLLYIDKETIHHESIFLALAKVPMIRRNHVMFIGQGPMGCIRNGALFYNFCEIFLKNIVLEDVEESLDALMDRLINDWRDQLRHNPDQEEIRRLAGCISRFAGDLGLNQEHEIVQLAIRTSILLLSANSDLKNPYNILQRLEAKRAEPMNWDNMNPSIEILNGYSLSFNPTFLDPK